MKKNKTIGIFLLLCLYFAEQFREYSKEASKSVAWIVALEKPEMTWLITRFNLATISRLFYTPSLISFTLVSRLWPEEGQKEKHIAGTKLFEFQYKACYSATVRKHGKQRTEEMGRRVQACGWMTGWYRITPSGRVHEFGDGEMERRERNGKGTREWKGVWGPVRTSSHLTVLSHLAVSHSPSSKTPWLYFLLEAAWSHGIEMYRWLRSAEVQHLYSNKNTLTHNKLLMYFWFTAETSQAK